MSPVNSEKITICWVNNGLVCFPFTHSLFNIYLISKSVFVPSVGILELDFCEYWKCAQLFAHWVHWSQMAGHIQNVLSMCPLGISGSHNRVYLKCTQHLITGYIGVTCWLWSQCFHHVPSGYLGPCPQCEQRAKIRLPDPLRWGVFRRDWRRAVHVPGGSSLLSSCGRVQTYWP